MGKVEIMGNQPSWEEEKDISVMLEESPPHEIVLHNDDVNTFDFVIESLVQICEHSYEQAEQCTWLIHYKGKCSVKSGSLEDLRPKCSALLDRGLSAELV